MALHNIIVERQHKFVICFIERHAKLNKNRHKELNNCVHLVLVHNNGKVKLTASFNLDIFQTVVLWMIIFMILDKMWGPSCTTVFKDGPNKCVIKNNKVIFYQFMEGIFNNSQLAISIIYNFIHMLFKFKMFFKYYTL